MMAMMAMIMTMMMTMMMTMVVMMMMVMMMCSAFEGDQGGDAIFSKKCKKRTNWESFVNPTATKHTSH